jgi:glycosyltransferase involved in cell wall biosynthesis
MGPPGRPRRLVVLHVLEAIESGCARHVVDLVRHVEGVDHHVAVPRERVGGVTDRAAFADVEAAGGHVHLVEMRRSPPHPRNAAAAVVLARLARRVGAGVVHGHSSIGGALARASATAVGLPRVYTPNGLAAGWGPTQLERLLGRVTHRLVAVSASEGEEVLRRRLIPEARLVIIPNGIDVAPVAPRPLRPLLGVAPGTPLVGTLGRLSWQKAPEVFVQACARIAVACPGAEFVLIGDGPDRPAFRAAVDGTGLGEVFHWLPVLPDAAAHLHDLDVFCLASRFEGGPYAPLEAIRAGVPVVLSDVVGNRDVVEPGRSGLLVPPDDPPALAQAVIELLRDAACRQRYAAAAGERLRGEFDVRRMGQAHAGLYEQVAKSCRPSRIARKT